MTAADSTRRDRWCETGHKRAVDLTVQDIIMTGQPGKWTEILGVYRNMDEWEAEFGPLPAEGDQEGDNALATDVLNWSYPAWVILRLRGMSASSTDDTEDRLLVARLIDLFEVQTLPAPGHEDSLDPAATAAYVRSVAGLGEPGGDEASASATLRSLIRGALSVLAGGSADLHSQA